MHIAWGLFLAALAVFIIVPGPDFVLVSKSAARSSRDGWLTAAGVTCGLLVHATAVTFGLSALVTAVPGALTAVKIFGACYLCFLGFTALRRAGRQPVAAPEVSSGSARSVFLRGVLGDVLNPKVMLIFLTLVPQALDPARPATGQAALLSGVIVVIFAVFWSIVVIAARRLGSWLAKPKARRRFERGCGGALIAMAASIALS